MKITPIKITARDLLDTESFNEIKADFKVLVESLIHIQQVACSGSPELGIATEALQKIADKYNL